VRGTTIQAGPPAITRPATAGTPVVTCDDTERTGLSLVIVVLRADPNLYRGGLMLRKVFGFTMAIALLAPMGVLAAGPAGAATGTSCKSVAGSVTVAPGLTDKLLPQVITFNLPVKGCTGGGVKSGTVKGTDKVTKPGDCKTLGTPGPPQKITGTITWNTKATSTFSASTTTKGLTFTITGSVTAGLFKGTKVSEAGTYHLPSGAICTTAHPLKTLTVTGTKPFVI